MTVETFVIVPLDQFNHMEEKMKPQPKKEPPEPEKEDVEPETEVENHESEAENHESEADEPPPPKISKVTKTLIKNKSIKEQHFNKLLQALEKYQETSLEIPNLKQLVKASLGQSKRKLPNEDLFYKLILQHQLFHLVRNKNKIRQFYPMWFRVA